MWEAVACYKGKTGRNSYTRSIRNLDNLDARSEEKSVLWLHSVYHHQNQADIKYSMRVTGVYKDSLDRQVMEKVQIQHFKGPVLMNMRTELGGVRIERTSYRRWGNTQ